LTAKHLKDFDLYLKELNRWRKKINLVSRENDREIILKDFLDSLTLAKYISGWAAYWIWDRGWISWVSVKDHLSWIEGFFPRSNPEEGLFFEEVQRLLGVEGVEIRWAAENSGIEDLFCRFDFVVSRAFGSIQKLAFEGSRFVRKGG